MKLSAAPWSGESLAKQLYRGTIRRNRVGSGRDLDTMGKEGKVERKKRIMRDSLEKKNRDSPSKHRSRRGRVRAPNGRKRYCGVGYCRRDIGGGSSKVDPHTKKKKNQNNTQTPHTQTTSKKKPQNPPRHHAGGLNGSETRARKKM